VGRGLSPRRWELAPRRRPDQRERERERRVSDADASYNRPISGTRTLKHAIPKRNHANNNSLSVNDPVPLPRSPSKHWLPATKTDPNPTLCLANTPNGMPTQATYTRRCRNCQPFSRNLHRLSRHHSAAGPNAEIERCATREDAAAAGRLRGGELDEAVRCRRRLERTGPDWSDTSQLSRDHPKRERYGLGATGGVACGDNRLVIARIKRTTTNPSTEAHTVGSLRLVRTS
jgi:hypothetical protein